MTGGPVGDAAGADGATRAPDEGAALVAKTEDLAVADGPKKRKKRRSKKVLPPPAPVSVVSAADNSPKIARFKHTKYISCYHVSGPWLQLPLELLQTLLLVNSGPTSLPGEISDGMSGRRRLRAQTDEEALRDQVYEYEDQVPPPVDPRCFRTVVKVRELVEEALDLVLRATAGLGTSAYDTGRKSGAIVNTRQHRLRSLAVAKLARAYGLDEVATSVVVMQSGSSLDDVADRVLKIEPENLAAHYVGHFHDKIPGR